MFEGNTVFLPSLIQIIVTVFPHWTVSLVEFLVKHPLCVAGQIFPGRILKACLQMWWHQETKISSVHKTKQLIPLWQSSSLSLPIFYFFNHCLYQVQQIYHNDLWCSDVDCKVWNGPEEKEYTFWSLFLVLQGKLELMRHNKHNYFVCHYNFILNSR